MSDQESYQIIPASTELAPAASEQKPSIKDVFAKLLERAKDAREKVAPVADKLTSMVKGNVEAVSVSRKTLGAGLKDIGQGSIADGRQAIQTVVADVKELAALRSPKEILRLQGKLTTRNFDSIRDFAAKNGKALRALASEAVTPIGDRLQANLDTVRKKAA